MALIPIDSVGSIGIIKDKKPHELPLEAWSSGQNVRFTDNYVEKCKGESLWQTPTVAPYWAMAVPQPLAYYWLYAGLAKVYAYDGSTHTNVTRQTLGVDVDYTATADLNWTGGVLNGVPVLNNGMDVPQMWLPTEVSTKLEMLDNWNANWTCGALRPFKNFLIALDVTKSGTRYPQMVKWSHPADPGALPISWDETDPAKDAGEYSLAETAGFVVDCVPLRDANIVYKEDAIFLMQFIGGINIFRFAALSKQLGILSRRCAVEYRPGLHAVFCVGDIVKHDGQQVVSILDGRMRKWLAANLDQTYYGRSFTCNFQAKHEVWFCFPLSGNAYPNMAMIWNWQDNTLTLRQLNDVSHIEPGLLSDVPGTWAGASGTWDAQTAVWDVRPYGAAENSLIQVRPNATALTLTESTNLFSGSAMTSSVERTGIAVPFVAGKAPDFSAYKFIRSIWPRIEGTDGGQVSISVGTQNQIDGSVTWESPVLYTIGTTQKIDCRVAGRLLAVKIESTSDVEWRLHGYEIDVQPGGRF